MYSIYVDGELIHHPNMVSSGHGVLNPKLTLELNKSGSLTFLLPPNNCMYDNIQKLKSIVTVMQDGEELFRGRVLHDEKDFYNRKDVYCEGELSFLLDSVLRPNTFTGDIPTLFRQFIDNHNQQVDNWKQFTVGDIDEKYSTYSTTIEYNEYTKTLNFVNDKLVNAYGGYLRPRLQNGIRYIDYVSTLGSDYIEDVAGVAVYGKKSSQVIEFGKNLLDISEYISADEVFTVLIPLGKDGTTITSANDSKDYIEDETGIALFGKIWNTHKWDDIQDPETLKVTGKAYLASSIEMAVSLAVKAVDLHNIHVDVEKISLGDHVRVISTPHKLDKYFQCSKIVIDLANLSQTEFTLGRTYTTLTEKQTSNTKVIQDTSSAIQLTKETASEAQKLVEKIDEGMTPEGIFKLLTNNGKVQGLILDEKTGDIYINATYIKSGTLTLGGENPTLMILDKDGIECVRADENGIRILKGEVNATSGTLDSVTIMDGITISSKSNNDLTDLSLVKIEEIDTGFGTSYRITFGELTGRSTPLAIEGSSIEIRASNSIILSADNIIYENPIEVPDIYVTKEWTPLTLENGFENAKFEAKQLEYKKIGNHVYIRGSVQFPADTAWSGSALTVAFLPAAIKPTRGNHYVIAACGGARIARILVTQTDLKLEWMRLLSTGANDTSATGIWCSMTMDYWLD